MRRWLSLNGLLVAAAALAALVLTVARPSPEGLINLGVGDREVRAAPGAGQASAQKHNLGALKIVHRTLIRIRESYVDPSRIDPKKMLYAALDSVQFNVPEVMVEADPGRDEIQVVVNDKQALSRQIMLYRDFIRAVFLGSYTAQLTANGTAFDQIK